MRSRGAPVSYSTESPSEEMLPSLFLRTAAMALPSRCFVGRILGVHAWPDRGVPRGPSASRLPCPKSQ